MSGNSSNDSCAQLSIFEDTQFFYLVGLRCFLSLVSSMFIICMIATLVLFQKYRVYTQRLILYLAVSTLSYQLVTTLDVASIQAYSDPNALNYCIFIGFLTQVTVWWPTLATTAIVADIFIKVAFEKTTEKFEFGLILFIFALPFFINLIPFVNLAYGPSGYFCWIRDLNLDDCSKFDFGYILQIVLYYIPSYSLTGLMFVLLGTSFAIIRKKRHAFLGHDLNEKRRRKMMEREIKPLLYYPFIFLVTSAGSLVLTLYGLFDNNATAILIIGILVSVLFRLQGVVITLLFTLDPDTRRRLNRKEMKLAWKQLLDKDKTEEYPVHYERTDSVRVMTRL